MRRTLYPERWRDSPKVTQLFWAEAEAKAKNPGFLSLGSLFFPPEEEMATNTDRRFAL